jgi:hypothetical protein
LPCGVTTIQHETWNHRFVNRK